MLQEILTAVFTVLFLCVAVIINGYFWGWFYSGSTDQDETSYFRTDDGWRLAIHHYRPQGRSTDEIPVVLCHGLGANRYIFDAPGSPSLARFLSKRGRDVWVAELRGSGMSDRPGIFLADVPYSWTFDDHLHYDVPAIISHVINRTSAGTIHWVGHSMGGMLIHAYLSEHKCPAICSAITLGAPTDFSKTTMKAIIILSRMRFALRLMPIPPMPFNGRLVVPIADRVPACLLGLFYPPNIAPDVARRIVALGSELITSWKLWLDFGRFVDTGVLAHENGRPYLKNISQSSVPIFLIAGAKDAMAPPDSVSAACVPGKDSGERLYNVLGKTSGTVEDYGHVDLLVGMRAEQEVFPSILEWLAAHDPLNKEAGDS